MTQQPHPATASHATRLKIEFAQATDPGRDPNKQVNEDSCGFSETKFGYLCVLCDGMGGHYGGQEASRTAIKTIFEVFERSNPGTPPAHAMKFAVEEAGRRVYQLGGPAENRTRPGSTVVAMLLHDRGVDVAHVGDSRAYVIRQNQIYPLTRDHSMVQGMIDAGMLTEEQAIGHPDANKITRALGMKTEVDVELRPEPMELFPGDILFQASDGLTDLALGPDILGCVRQALASGDVQHASNMLVKMANDRGGHDNITVQMARVVEVGPKGTATVPGMPSASTRPLETVAMASSATGSLPATRHDVTPAAAPIQPAADWARNQHEEMPTEIMGPSSMRQAPQANPGWIGGQAAGGARPQSAPPSQRPPSGVAPTAAFEAYRVEGSAASLPLPPAGYRGAAMQHAAAPFSPMPLSAAQGQPSRGGIVFLIIGGATAIAILVLVVLWAVLR